LADFANVDEIEATLNKLHDLNDQQLVVKLDREPGKRDSRYAHLFCGEQELQVPFQASENTVSPQVSQDTESNSEGSLERIARLEEQVNELTVQLTELKEIVDILSE
jgi:uncharacterized protein YceH (UPF0502 family)